MSWVLKGSMRVAFRQIYSIIDSCLVLPDHVPIKCPLLAVRLHEVRLGVSRLVRKEGRKGF